MDCTDDARRAPDRADYMFLFTTNFVMPDSQSLPRQQTGVYQGGSSPAQAPVQQENYIPPQRARGHRGPSQSKRFIQKNDSLRSHNSHMAGSPLNRTLLRNPSGLANSFGESLISQLERLSLSLSSRQPLLTMSPEQPTSSLENRSKEDSPCDSPYSSRSPSPSSHVFSQFQQDIFQDSKDGFHHEDRTFRIPLFRPFASRQSHSHMHSYSRSRSLTLPLQSIVDIIKDLYWKKEETWANKEKWNDIMSGGDGREFDLPSIQPSEKIWVVDDEAKCNPDGDEDKMK